jgi:hypothetical protein
MSGPRCSALPFARTAGRYELVGQQSAKDGSGASELRAVFIDLLGEELIGAGRAVGG